MADIAIPTNPYNDKRRLYSAKTISFDPGITALVGCNGSGKSTVMMLLKEHFKGDEKVLILSYDDRSEGGSHLIEKFAFYEDFQSVGGMMCSSEGERIWRGVGEFVASIHKKILKSNAYQIWILLDAIGSGLSIDLIDEIKDFAHFLETQWTDKEIYFVVSTNEYEFAKDEDCIDVTTFKHVKFSDYDSYRNFILKTREKKNKRLEN